MIYFLCTVYEREKETLALLSSIREIFSGVSWKFIVSDNSEVASYTQTSNVDNVFMFKTQGLYWNRGMISAFEFMRKNFEINGQDTVICLNNDITLRASLCVDEILDSDVYVGSFVDGKGKFTYGLRRGYSKYLPLFFGTNFTGPCTFNMNFVAFKYTILKQHGFLDNRYSHGFGDYDLGLSLSFQGIVYRQSSLPIGICERNEKSGTSRDKRLSLIKRFELFHSVKECPFWEHVYFLKKNSKIFWPIVLFYRYLRVVI